MASNPMSIEASWKRFNEKEYDEKGYTFIDNFLPIEIFKRIHGTLTGTGEFSLSPIEFATNPWLEQFVWQFGPGVVGKEVTGGYEEQHIYFTNILYLSTPLSKWCSLIAGPLMERTPNLRQLQRVKVNLYPRDTTFFEHASHHDNDWKDEHGALFLVNTCNGYTKRHDGTKTDSVANRMLYFRPHLDHSSTNTTDELCRVTVNFNYF